MPNFKSPILLQKLQRKARWAINDLGVLLRPRVDSVAMGPYRRILVYHGVDQKGKKNSMVVLSAKAYWSAILAG